MNNEEAMLVLTREMTPFRMQSYAELAKLVDQTTQIKAEGPSGTKYQVEIQIVWDDPTNGDLRIIGAIDDGGWRALAPLTDDFILRSDGSFVGE